MAYEQAKLQDVKLTSQTDTGAISILIAIQNGNEPSKTYTFSKKDDNYQKLDDTITKFQNNNLSQNDFQNKIIDLVLSRNSTGIKDVIKKSKALSSHVQLLNDHIYVDGNPINSPLEKHVLSIMNDKEKNSGWSSLIHFVEKLYNNTSDYVRKQLYGWLSYQSKNGKLTFTDDGNLIAYKGVKTTVIDGKQVPVSIHEGHGFVNGVEVEHDNLRNDKGNIVEIPRNEVDDDPYSACSIGLHVGSWDYASSFGYDDTTLVVEVNPEDVVSVPADCDEQKIRVCKYKVIDVTMKPLNMTVFNADDNNPLDNSDNNVNLNNNEPVPDVNDIDKIEYTKKSGETRKYLHNELLSITDNDKYVLIELADGDYRSLLKSNVHYVLNDNIPSEKDVDYIYYRKPSEPVKVYKHIQSIENKGNNILILSDKGYRTLNKQYVQYIKYDDSKNEDTNNNIDDTSEKLPDIEDINYIEYVTQSGEHKKYNNIQSIENKENNILILTDDGYKLLNKERVHFELKKSDTSNDNFDNFVNGLKNINFDDIDYITGIVNDENNHLNNSFITINEQIQAVSVDSYTNVVTFVTIFNELIKLDISTVKIFTK